MWFNIYNSLYNEIRRKTKSPNSLIFGIIQEDTNDTENKVYETLDKLNIKYDRVDHEPVFTAEEAKECVSGLIEGVRCKNLFLQDTKKNYMKCLN